MVEDKEDSLFLQKQNKVFDGINNERFSEINEWVKQTDFNNLGWTSNLAMKLILETVRFSWSNNINSVIALGTTRYF